MLKGSSDKTVTVEGNIVRGPETRRADAEAALVKLAFPGEVKTDVPTVATYTDFDPEPTWILTLPNADQAMLVKQLLDGKG